jgi:3'-5' exoribonuclease
VGRLLGHIPIGHAFIEVQCSHIPHFPANKKILLQHMILSHHGQLEFGSPKRPKTLEAIILHHADLLDAQISNFLEIAGNLQKMGAKWDYSPMFERYIYGGAPDMLQANHELSGTPHTSPSTEDRGRIPSTNKPQEIFSNDDLLGPVEDSLEG